jgi:hypothetical protein
VAKIDRGWPDPYNTTWMDWVQKFLGKRGIYGDKNRPGEKIV